MSEETTPLLRHIRAIAQAAGPASVHAYVLRHGREFHPEPLTQEEQDFIQQIQWKSRKPKQCFLNAQMEAIILTETPGITLRYVEGYINNTNGYGIYHAWLSVNGKIVDPTIRVEQPPGRVVGEIPPGWQYFGVEMEAAVGLHCIQHGAAVPIIDDWQCRWPLIQQEGKQAAPDQEGKPK